MDAFHIILSLTCVALVGAVGWLAWRRAELVARAMLAEQAQRAADEARAELSARCERAEQQAGNLATQAAALAQRVEAEAAKRAAELDGLAREHAQALAAERTLAAEKIVGAQRIAEAHSRERDASEQRLKQTVEQAETRFKDAFEALAGQSLRKASEQFLVMAEQKLGGQIKEGETQLRDQKAAVERLVNPISETLKETHTKLEAMEHRRVSEQSSLMTEVKRAGEASAALQTETSRLVQALREPRVRGYYGEIQLQRVAELAGMRKYCDFVEQAHTIDADGNRLRPDMVVRLPNGREIVVDAKTNIQPYMEALQATTPEATEERLQAFAAGIAKQADALGRKGYWRQHPGSPEFVVMFVPGDQFVDAALSRRPDLLDAAAGQGVILASPSTLIAMLRAVAVSFREEKLAHEAAELLKLGSELHERAATALAHVEKLGESLGRAVGHFNSFVGSYESRLEPTLERFEQIGAAGGKTRPELEPITVTVRSVQALLPDPTPNGGA